MKKNSQIQKFTAPPFTDHLRIRLTSLVKIKDQMLEQHIYQAIDSQDLK